MPSEIKYRSNVGAVIFNKNKLIWIGERIDILTSSEWQMPQGGIDNLEDPKKSIIREVYEETGIKNIKIIKEINEWFKYDLPKNISKNKWNGKYKGQKQKWYLLYFYGDDKEINLNISNYPEFKSWKWEKKSNIIKNVKKFRKSIYTEVFNIFYPIINNYNED